MADPSSEAIPSPSGWRCNRPEYQREAAPQSLLCASKPSGRRPCPLQDITIEQPALRRAGLSDTCRKAAAAPAASSDLNIRRAVAAMSDRSFGAIRNPFGLKRNRPGHPNYTATRILLIASAASGREPCRHATWRWSILPTAGSISNHLPEGCCRGCRAHRPQYLANWAARTDQSSEAFHNPTGSRRNRSGK